MTAPSSPVPLLDGPPAFQAALARHADRLDLDLIRRALRFSMTAHRGQKRMSGEDFVNHTIEVATILLGQFLDCTSVAAALLHTWPRIPRSGWTICPLHSGQAF